MAPLLTKAEPRMSRNKVHEAASAVNSENSSRRQIERAVSGVPGLRLATYPSGRRAYIYRFRDPVTGRKTSRTLGPAD